MPSGISETRHFHTKQSLEVMLTQDKCQPYTVLTGGLTTAAGSEI